MLFNECQIMSPKCSTARLAESAPVDSRNGLELASLSGLLLGISLLRFLRSFPRKDITLMPAGQSHSTTLHRTDSVSHLASRSCELHLPSAFDASRHMGSEGVSFFLEVKFVSLEIGLLAAWKAPTTGTEFPLTKTLWDMIVRVDRSPEPRGRWALGSFHAA